MTKLLGRLALAVMVALASNSAQAGLSPVEDTWSIALRSGIAPSVFNKNARFTSTVHRFGVTPIAGAVDITTPTQSRKSSSAAFSKLYTMPFFMGFDLAYMTTNCVEVFVNFDYSHACAKSLTIPGTVGTIAANTKWDFKDLNNYGFHVGGRFYFKPINCMILPFAGAKLGFGGYGSCGSQDSVELLATNPLTFSRLRGKGCFSLSGGVQLGFDWQIAESYLMTFMSEMIGTSSRLFNSNFQIHQAASNVASPATHHLGLASQVTRNPRSTVSFPITLGLRVRL